MTDEAEKRPVGRPSSYTDDIAERICERLAQGEPLARICDDDDMPAFRTVFRWEAEKPDFRQLSARAREIGTHHLADDCISIADGDGDPADKRIRIDTRLRLIGKWNAKNYGDKATHEHTGANGGPIQTVDLSKVSDDDLKRLEHVLGATLLADTSGEGVGGTDQGGDQPEG